MKAAKPARSKAYGLWRRIAAFGAMRALLTCAVLGGVFALGVYVAQEPATAWLAKLGQGGGAGGSGDASASVEMTVSDPVDQFSDTRVGHLLFKPFEGDHCRRVLFDNRTGDYLEAGQVYCGRPTPEQEIELGLRSTMPSSDRIKTLSKAFRK